MVKLCDLCQCQQCGRMFSPNVPTSKLSHLDACRLSRLFNNVANLGNAQDYRINDWLKTIIAGSQT